MLTKIKNSISNCLNSEYNLELQPQDIVLSKPPKKNSGDIAIPLFDYMKKCKTSPQNISSVLNKSLIEDGIIEKSELVGPYLNVYLSSDFLVSYFKNFDLPTYKTKNKNIVIDYIGTNVGKPLHLGHMCSPNIGQAIYGIYERFGYNVIGDNHWGDWGIIFGKLIVGYRKFKDMSEYSEDSTKFLGDIYIKATQYGETSDSAQEEFRQAFKKLSRGESAEVALWKKFMDISISSAQQTFDRLEVRADYNIGESFYEGLDFPKTGDYPDLKWNMQDIVKELLDKNIATKNEDGSVGIEFSSESKLPSCMLQKSDGTHGYLASDLAAIKYRLDNWSPEKLIYVVDSRQSLHFKQAFEITRLAGWIEEFSPEVQLIHAPFGTITMDGKALSSRKGNTIGLGEILDTGILKAKEIIKGKNPDLNETEQEELAKIIGVASLKYGYLKKNRESDSEFDIDAFISFEGNNAPYIQYNYVRALKILNKFDDQSDAQLNKDISFDISDELKNLIIILSEYEQVLIEAKDNNYPHVLLQYVYNLTKAFSSYYANSNIINEKDINKQKFQIIVLKNYIQVVKEIFDIVKIGLPNKM